MSKKHKAENNLTRLIKGLGLNITEFARTIGVSTSMMKKVVEGKRAISQELASKIFSETGVLFDEKAPDSILEYTKQDHQNFKETTVLNEEGAQIAARQVGKQVELLLLAASRPTIQKSLPVFNALNLALAKIKDEYRLEKPIDLILRDRHATQTKLYKVKDLRENDLLANQVGFKDDPKYKDDDEVPLTKAVGWLPTKDIFNVAWQNRELLKELLTSKADTLTPEQEQKFKQMEKQIDQEIDTYMPGFKTFEDPPKQQQPPAQS